MNLSKNTELHMIPLTWPCWVLVVVAEVISKFSFHLLGKLIVDFCVALTPISLPMGTKITQYELAMPVCCLILFTEVFPR